MSDILASLIGGVAGLIGGSLLWWFVIGPYLDKVTEKEYSP
jgi:hypothetical protein